MRASIAIASAIALSCAAAGVARAGDPAAAEAAFLKGKQLLKGGQIAEACDAFDRSLALDPQFGTQYHLARCYEQLGRLASAWTQYRELAQRDHNPGRREDARKRAALLEPRLTRLLINFAGAVPGMVVTRNGDDITAAVGIETPVDTGQYTILARADGYKLWSATVTASGEGATVTVSIPALEHDVPDDEPGPPRQAPGETSEPGGATTAAAPARGGGRTTLALSVGGAGLIATGVGVFFGARASARWSDARALCGDDLLCDNPDDLRAGNRLVAEARTAGTVSTVLVGAGIAAVVGGAVLWLTAPDGPEGRELALVPDVGPDRFLLTAIRSF